MFCRICSTINVNYKTTFFFFILSLGTHGAPRYAISGDPVLVRKRVARLLLQAVTSECLRKREKKRESEGAREREGGSEWGEGEGGCCCRFEKAEKLLGALSHRKTLGLEEAQGSWASHQLPICHSLTALSNRALSRSYQWRLKTMNRQISLPLPVHWNTRLCSHTPRALTFPLPQFLSCFFMPFFFNHKPLFSFWVLSRCWFLLCQRG